MKIEITFPDKSKKKFDKGVSGLDIANSISEGLARAAIAIKIDGTTTDLSKSINKNATIEILTFKDKEGRSVYWHSAAHLLAHAIKRLFPKAKPTIGPDLDEGFYYDFDDLNLEEEDIPKIEAEMKAIVKENFEPVRIEYKSKEEAKKVFKNNKYKVEMIDSHEEGSSAYEQGDFVDLCRGPHVPRTGMFKAVKITKLAAAYWRGDQKNKQLTRIYGIAFPDKKLMKEYLERIEEAKKRDHRRIGKDQDLLMFHEYSPGSAFFTGKGAIIYNELLKLMREEYFKRDYEEVITPLMYDKELWITSGHWDHYQEDMFFIEADNKTYGLKPMNCPSHLLMYTRKNHSYRELPVRIADFAPLHRNELRGVLTGLTRVRKFSQDDAHIICTPEQMEKELLDLIDFVKYIYEEVFDFEYHLELSTRPEKAMGSKKYWDMAEGALENAMKKKKMPYVINKGDGAFYGPKIDIHVKDAIGRSWQLATIQIDPNMPERFKATYEGKDGKKHTPIMIHRAILGSAERFIGVLIEHLAGRFPLWLSPVQVKLLPIADRHKKFCEEVKSKMRNEGIRVEIDDRAETLNKKIREAQLERINYILVIGDKEVEAKSVNVRTRDEKVHGTKKVDSFIKELLTEIKERKL